MMDTATPTLKTIAQNLNLSIGTVQRALHGKGGYSPETQRLVIEEAKRVGYTTNTAASALRHPPITLGVLLPAPVGINRFFFGYLWQGIEAACRDLLAYQIRLVRQQFEPMSDMFFHALEGILTDRDNPIEGLITIAHRDPRFDNLMEEFAQRKIPVFIINYTGDKDSRAFFAIDSNRSIGKLAGDIFSAIHRRTTGTVLLLGGSRNNLLHTERTADCGQALARDCPGIRTLEIHMFHELPQLEQFIIRCAKQFDDIVGIFAASSRETLVMCQAMDTLGWGGKITTVGTDAYPELLPYFERDILTASIYQYPAKQSYLAVKLLLAEITKIPQPHSIENFPISTVFKSNAAMFCGADGLI